MFIVSRKQGVGYRYEFTDNTDIRIFGCGQPLRIYVEEIKEIEEILGASRHSGLRAGIHRNTKSDGS